MFDTLRQACIEPEERVFIGAGPPRGALGSHTINSVSVTNAPWIANGAVGLNAGPVAVIGARGSGKTASAGRLKIIAAIEDPHRHRRNPYPSALARSSSAAVPGGAEIATADCSPQGSISSGSIAASITKPRTALGLGCLRPGNSWKSSGLQPSGAPPGPLINTHVCRFSSPTWRIDRSRPSDLRSGRVKKGGRISYAPLTRAHLQDELTKIVAATGSRVLMFTHDVDEAVLLSDDATSGLSVGACTPY